MKILIEGSSYISSCPSLQTCTCYQANHCEEQCVNICADCPNVTMCR